MALLLLLVFVSAIFTLTEARGNFTSYCQPQEQLTDVIKLEQHDRGFLTLDKGNSSKTFECSWLLQFSNQDDEQITLDKQKVVVLDFIEFGLIADRENSSSTDNCLKNSVEIWSLGNNYSTGDLRAVHCGRGRVPDFYGGLQRSVLVKLKICDSIDEPKLKVHFTTKFVGSVPSGKDVDATASDDEFLCPPSTHFVCLFNGMPRCRLNSCWCDSISNCDDMLDEKDCMDVVTFKRLGEEADYGEFEELSGSESLSDDGDATNDRRSDSGCGSPRNQMGMQGAFHSPHYPCDYPANLTCVWEITTPPGTSIVIAFNTIFSISADEEATDEDGKCPYDSLTMFHHDSNGQKNAVGIVCGSKKPASKIIKTNKVTVNYETFRPNERIGFHGFRLQWAAITHPFLSANRTKMPTSQTDTTLKPDAYLELGEACSGPEGVSLKGLEGFITSPSYGVSHYPASTTCLWRIEPDVALLAPGYNFLISLEFVYFEVEGSSKCQEGDWLEVFSIDPKNNRRRGRYCSSNKPPQNSDILEAPAIKQPIELKFSSDNDGKQDYGFQIRYTVKMVKREEPAGKQRELKFDTSPASCGIATSPVANSLFFRSSDEIEEVGDVLRAVAAGSNANPSDWPWIVQLSFQGHHMCAATVINEKWLVTAAHCFKGRYKKKAKWTAAIGKASLNSETAWDDKSPVIRPRIKNILVHRRYGKQMSKEFDIALIQLQEPLSFNGRFVKSLCLPSRDTKLDDYCFVAGWSQKQLKDLQMPIISLEQCRQMTKRHWATVTDTMLCGGYMAGGTGACPADSGSPLICRVGSRWELHGIVSFGSKCSPSVTTRVFSYVNWINTIFSKFVSTTSHFNSV